jgi:Kef-type K+ transport system membrane component KefB
VFSKNRDVLLKVRVIALAFLTPFFFINAGLSVSLSAVVAGIFIVIILFFVKMSTKFLGVLPPCNKFVGKNSVYIALLMSTGLTFGTISAQYGLTSGIIDKTQFSILVTVVMLTAIIPVIIAQKWFNPWKEQGAADDERTSAVKK